MLRRLASPVVFVLASAALVGDVGYLAVSRDESRQSVVGRSVRNLIGCGERAMCGLTSPRVFMLFQEPDGRVVEWGGEGGLTRQEVQARYDKDPKARCLVLVVSARSWREGMWASTSEVWMRDAHVNVAGDGGAVSAEERQAVEEWYARSTSIRKQAWCEVATTATGRERLWSGIAHSAAAAGVGMLALISGVTNGVRVRRWWRERRYGPGACRGCGYSLAGLGAGVVCPECGRG